MIALTLDEPEPQHLMDKFDAQCEWTVVTIEMAIEIALVTSPTIMTLTFDQFSPGFVVSSLVNVQASNKRAGLKHPIVGRPALAVPTREADRQSAISPAPRWTAGLSASKSTRNRLGTCSAARVAKKSSTKSACRMLNVRNEELRSGRDELRATMQSWQNLSQTPFTGYSCKIPLKRAELQVPRGRAQGL